MITDRVGLLLILTWLCTVVSPPPRTCYNLSTADKSVLTLFLASLLLCSNFKLYCSPLVVFSSFLAKGQTIVSIMIRMNVFSSLASFVLQTEVPIQLRETKICSKYLLVPEVSLSPFDLPQSLCKMMKSCVVIIQKNCNNIVCCPRRF